jgi:hypothetical protein
MWWRCHEDYNKMEKATIVGLEKKPDIFCSNCSRTDKYNNNATTKAGPHMRGQAFAEPDLCQLGAGWCNGLLTPPFHETSCALYYICLRHPPWMVADLWVRLWFLTNRLNSAIIPTVAPGSADNPLQNKSWHFLLGIFTTTALLRLGISYQTSTNISN